MADVQATFEFSIEFTHFYNVDLYVGGYYQIRSLLKGPKKLPCKIEISIPRSVAPHLFPASIVNGRAVGTTFEILYKDEDIQLSDVVEFRVHIPVKLLKLQKTISFTLMLELWYINKEEMVKKAADDVFSAFECVSKRFVTLNMPVFRGLHYHRPILFDYFHLCALSFTVHASLTGLTRVNNKQQDKLSRAKLDSSTQLSVVSNCNSTSISSVQNSPKPSGVVANYLPFEEAVFGSATKSAANRLQNSFQFHRNICWLLLTAYEALELKLTQFLAYLPSRYQIRIQSVDCAKKFEVLQQNIQRLTEENEILSAIESTMTLLSAELNLLWNQFLDLFRSQPNVAVHLGNEHHSFRVRRFAESFFSTECSTLNLMVNTVGHSLKVQEKLVDYLRKSPYFIQPLPLGVACEDSDGTPEVIPVVFEERYHPVTTHRGRQASVDQRCSETTAATSADDRRNRLIAKDSLSLDLIHVNRPAVIASGDPSLIPPPPPTDKKQTDQKRSIRKKLFSRSSSVKIFRKSSKLLTFPLSDVELTKFENKHNVNGEKNDQSQSKSESKLKPSNGSVYSTNDKALFGSMPNLKMKLKPLSRDQSNIVMSLDQIKLEFCDNLRKGDSDPSLSTSTTKLKRASSIESSDKVENGQSIDEVFDNVATSTTGDLHNRRISEMSDDANASSNLSEPEVVIDESLSGVITSPSQLPSSEDSKPRLTSGVEQEILNFVASKEEFKLRMKTAKFEGHLCSDFTTFPSRISYFSDWCDRDFDDESTDYHLIVCVHGLDGTSADLRMVRAYIELGLGPASGNLKFLMSKRNQVNTFDDFETMTKNLVDEVLLHLSQCSLQPNRISFIGHSLGNIIIRSALCDPRLEPWLERLHTFLSLNGPHCGILYNNNSVVNMGIKLVQRWKKSMSLQQLALKDSADLRESFLYKLSQKPCLQYFKNVLLVGSYDDFYVPIHSALIQICRAAVKDSTTLGSVYTEMVQNLAEPLVNSSRTTVVRYSVYHSPQASSTASQLLGRAAHIAVLDSDLFIEKLLTVSALRYFV